MNFWYKTAIFGSIIFVLIFLRKVNIERNPNNYVAKPQYLEAVPIPQLNKRNEIAREELLDKLSEDTEPFRQLFFETMVFKGVIKDNSDRWQAIFIDKNAEKDSKFIRLAKDETHDGVTVLYVNEHGCGVRYGNIERKFDVK